MNTPLSDYIQKVCLLVNLEDSQKFRSCITINPGINEGTIRAHFPEPNDFDLHPIPEKFRNVVKSYLKLMKSVYIANSINASFFDLNEMVNNLNRAADTQTNWINQPLINACTELISVYQVRLKNFPEEEEMELSNLENNEYGNSSSSLERLAATINGLFKLSLNDKNLDLSQSKRLDIYFFLGNLIKIYFKLGKLELAKSVEKALKGTRFNLPKLNGAGSSKRYAVTYLYYSALLSLDDADFTTSEEKLVKAMEILSCYKDPKNVKNQTEKILIILLPLKLYNKRLTPSNEIWEKFPKLKFMYKDNLFDAIKNGNLKKFDQALTKYQLILLKNHLYLLFEMMKSLCYLKLVKKTVSIIHSLNSETKSHIVPLSAIQLALEFSTNDSYKESDKFAYNLDAVECILANLISSGKIKGYLSHAYRCIVLSKANAFPSLEYK